MKEKIGDLTHADVINKVKPLMTRSLCNKKGFSSHLFFTEVSAGNRKNRESPDLIGFRNDNHTTMIEAKATRSDFTSDKNKAFRSDPALGMGSHRYYACPKGLISKDELPLKWGLIEIENGKASVSVWAEEIVDRNHAAEQNLLFSLLRRVNYYVPVQNLVQYDKLVGQQVSLMMKGDGKHSELENVKKEREKQWSKIENSISKTRV